MRGELARQIQRAPGTFAQTVQRFIGAALIGSQTVEDVFGFEARRELGGSFAASIIENGNCE
jgi:hypothetical protein